MLSRMPKDVRLYRCLLISPSDVEDEREAIADVIDRWNGTTGDLLGVRIAVVRWEQHAVPASGGRPQALINEQLVKDCDLGCALFWTRLGSPTGDHESGSVEEISALQARKAPVLIYQKTADVPQSTLSDERGAAQYQALQKKLGEYYSSAIIGRFGDLAALRELVLLHLGMVVGKLELARRGDVSPGSRAEVASLPTPDIRVSVRAVAMFSGRKRVRGLLEVQVQNHSPWTYYHSSFAFDVGDGNYVMWLRDPITLQDNAAKEVAPGNSISAHVPVQLLVKDDAPLPLRAVSNDRIGRQFGSDAAETAAAFKLALAAVAEEDE
jgi:hypothetical protein